MKFILSALIFVSLPAYANGYQGFDCKGECSGHKAGYEWAKENTSRLEKDISLCTTHSPSFDAGCLLYYSKYLENKIDDCGQVVDECSDYFYDNIDTYYNEPRDGLFSR